LLITFLAAAAEVGGPASLPPSAKAAVAAEFFMFLSLQLLSSPPSLSPPARPILHGDDRNDNGRCGKAQVVVSEGDDGGIGGKGKSNGLYGDDDRGSWEADGKLGDALTLP
jgi:hypothetical protein